MMDLFGKKDKNRESFDEYLLEIDSRIKTLQKDIDSLKRENYELKSNIVDLKNSSFEKDNQLRELEEKNLFLKKELNEFCAEFNNIQDSNNYLFNCLFLDYDLKVKGARKNLQELSLELLNFVASVCEKYNLDYWLDFGTLLGARRHENFIPFDDDIDISMPRKDYNKLLNVIGDEFKKYGLEEHVEIRHDFFNEFSEITFTQVVYLSKSNKLIGAIDIFPYDFTSKNMIYTTDYSRERNIFRKGIFENPDNRNVLENNFMTKLDLSYDKEEYMILGVDSPLSNLMIFETDKIYPQCTLNFADKKFKAPKNPYHHLKKLYGNWKLIPSDIHYHKRLNNIRNNRQLEKEYVEELKRIKKAVDSLK